MTDQALQDAVNAIRSHEHQFDVTIVCTTDDYQAAYWMDLLENGLLSGKNHRVLAVSEDWNAPGGAGNGLGTLYAWRKACALAKTKYGEELDLAAELAAGNISAALYHTAGKGTRLAPLPASENNNKPGVKLPFPLKLPDGSVRPLAVLEAVIRQTGLYARKGRLSVFWGDQVFLPSAPFQVESTHHIDILCTLLGDTAPTAEEWAAQGLEKYGVIAVLQQEGGDKTEAAQVEKVSHATAVQMLGALGGQVKQVGPSLGSFSVSSAILQALLTEFATELTDKNTSVDTDPGFWMPLTLSLDSYVHLMEQKGKDAADSMAHYNRMAALKKNFVEAQKDSGLGLFGAVNVGKDACWWDYGQLKLYSQNSLLLLQPDQANASADLLRQFLDCQDQRVVGSTVADGATVDATSYVIASSLGATSQVTNSLLANVTCPNVQATAGQAIIVNCVAKKITAGKGAILYNLLDDSEDGIVAPDGQVMVGLSSGGDNKEVTFERVLQSRMDIDGGKAWKQKLDMNEQSFEDVHKQNKEADIGSIAAARSAKFQSMAKAMGM